MHGLGSTAGSHGSVGGFKSTRPFLLAREGNPEVVGRALSQSLSEEVDGKELQRKTPWDETLLVHLQSGVLIWKTSIPCLGAVQLSASDCISLNIHFLVYRWLTHMVLIRLSSPGCLVFTFQVLVLAIHLLPAEPPGQRPCLFWGLKQNLNCKGFTLLPQ